MTTLCVIPAPERFIRRPAHKRGGPPVPAWVSGRLPSGVTITDAQITGATGQVGVRIYSPAATSDPLPGLLYLHGGGWVGGTPRTTDKLCAELAARAGLRVVSVGYRLAPDSPFPGPLNDAVEGLRWVFGHAQELGIDRTALGVAGDSAGGNLAAALAIRARDEDLPALRFQVLLYPSLDATFSAPSALSYDGPALTNREVSVYYAAYGGDTDRTDPLLSPLHVVEPAGLPPAIIVTAGFDCLQDEARLYAERLLAAGVPVDLQHYPNAPHGYLIMAALCSQAEPTYEFVAHAIRRSLAATQRNSV